MSDLIDREKVLDVISNWNDNESDIETLAFMISNIPTVEERKKGKWILHPEVKNIYGGIYIECSECHTKYVVQHIEDEKYCRNCGAEMERGVKPLEK